MRALLRKMARAIAPTAYGKLEALRVVDGQVKTEDADFAALTAEIADLQSQLAEIRQDNRRVAELYDVVFERIRQDNPLRSS